MLCFHCKSRSFKLALAFVIAVCIASEQSGTHAMIPLKSAGIKSVSVAKNSASTTHRTSSYISYFAICTTIRDQHEYVREWVEYHLRMGAGKIYITDHLSQPPILDTIFDFVSSGVVEYSYSVKNPSSQTQMYFFDRCFKTNSLHHQFIAFIDGDEFIVVNERGVSIPQALKAYEGFGGLTLNWMIFGSSGHIKRPKGGVLPNYFRCRPNYHVKSIVNTLHGMKSKSAHEFRYKTGFDAVDTNLKVVRGPYNPAALEQPDRSLFQVMYLNHYAVKSREDFDFKKKRGSPNMTFKNDTFWDRLEKYCTDNCTVLKMPSAKLPREP